MAGGLASKRSGQGSGAADGLRRRIRLMIVDDSMVARAVLARMVESDGGFEIAGVAGTAEHAIEALGQVQVDIILLDLEMPGLGGLKSIPAIIEAARGARILVVSSLAEEGAEATVAALALGATDTLVKPGGGRLSGRFSDLLMEKLYAIGHASRRAPVPFAAPVPTRPAPVGRAALMPLRAMAGGPLSMLMIGSSTGGIHAIGQLFEALPKRIGCPILVTQHLPAPFMPVFARQLSTAAGRDAVIAEDGMDCRADRIIVAPGDAHVTVELIRGTPRIRLMKGRSASGCLPSVDPMFASAAAAFGPEALGIVLTGMGRDGTEGAHKLVACGGSVVVQDEASCAVWGMPRAVAEAGLACAILPPQGIGVLVQERLREAACK
jgi:two-component system chemotaxis response regulator CheB